MTIKQQWKTLTNDEWKVVFTIRGEQLTGYPLHEYNGLYYFWPMGRQNQPKCIMKRSIGEAVEAYLRKFEPCDKSQHQSIYRQPIRIR